jgi:hypothetical protein
MKRAVIVLLLLLANAFVLPREEHPAPDTRPDAPAVAQFSNPSTPSPGEFEPCINL